MTKGPLADLTVVEVTSLVAGPAMGSLLQRLGANIIKIEQPIVGEPSRTVSPWGFLNYNFGKKSLSLNLKEKEGRDVLHKLIKKTNIFIENLGSDVSERLGSGHPGYSPHKAFKSRDGKYTFIATLSDSQWDKLRSLLEINLGDDYSKMNYRIRHRSIVENEVKRAIAKLDLDQAITLLSKDVPCARVNTVSDVYHDPELNLRKVIVKTNYKDKKKVGIVLPPVALGTRTSIGRLMLPEVGENTDVILNSLGHSKVQIKALKYRKVV